MSNPSERRAPARETATVYRAGSRRFFTKRAAWRHLAGRVIREAEDEAGQSLTDTANEWNALCDRVADALVRESKGDVIDWCEIWDGPKPAQKEDDHDLPF